MNPPRAPAPSRFIRGRGRGGGSYRPYFYFKRRGRTIPAHGRGMPHQNAGNVGGPTTNPLINVPQPTALASSFLRPQIYTAPEDIQQQIQIITIETHLPHPGWRLYYYKEPYEANSELVKRIVYMETHFRNYVAQYDYCSYQKHGCFELKANILRQDEELNQNWPSLMTDLFSSPLKTLATIGVAMHSLATITALEASSTLQTCTKTMYNPKVIKPRKMYARPCGFMAASPIARISALDVDHFYCVRGTVTDMGYVDAAASWVAFKCSRCFQEQAIKQTGFNPTRPYSCIRQGCLAKQGFIELRSSPFTRITPVQTIRISEALLDVLYEADHDSTNYIDVELKYDLVDTVYLGQEIVVAGALKMRSLQNEQEYDKSSTLTGAMQLFLKAASVVDAKFCDHPYTKKDMEAITMINGERDSFKLLIHSLAPQVYGHEMVKAGVLLSLIGGSGSQVHDEAEINVLLVGDPGVGKSNIARMCSKISQKGSLVQAKKGNSLFGRKLTYSVKGRTNYILEAGGLITGSNGHCSIDDIDRLTSQQESLINVLQSQSACMAYLSVFSTITTPTSVIATANSMRGHYDQSKLLTENIRINPTLLSEFHLVFVLLDKPNKVMDTSLTDHVRALQTGCKKNTVIENKFDQKPKMNNSMNMTEESEERETEEVQYDLNIRLNLNASEELEMDLLPAILIKKFIAYSRQQVKPLFISESADVLRQFYSELKQQTESSNSAISSSHLAGLIRLCQARARIDFSSEVTKVHVRDVICIVKQSNADIALGDYVDTNPATAIATTTQRGGTQGNTRKFIQMLQMRSNALARRLFDFDELKDMARRVGIQCGVTNLIDIVNLQGILLKKGPNMYEVMID